MLQNEGFPMVIGEYFSPWLKKILSFTALKCFRMNDFQWLFGNTFTMVEENFEFYCSEMLQNEWFLMIVGEYFSPWLKKISSFAAPECSRMRNDFRVIAQKEGLFSGFPGFLGSHIPVSGFSGFSGFSGLVRHPATANLFTYKHTNSPPQAKIFRKCISGCARWTNITYQQQGSFTFKLIKYK